MHRHRQKWLIKAASFFLLLLLIPSSTADTVSYANLTGSRSPGTGIAPRYAVLDLGADNTADYLNDNGQVILNASTSPTFWNQGTPTAITDSTGTYTSLVVHGLNNNGKVVGTCHTTQYGLDVTRAFTWTQTGTLVAIDANPVAGGAIISQTGAGINNDGTIIGYDSEEIFVGEAGNLFGAGAGIKISSTGTLTVLGDILTVTHFQPADTDWTAGAPQTVLSPRAINNNGAFLGTSAVWQTATWVGSPGSYFAPYYTTTVTGTDGSHSPWPSPVLSSIVQDDTGLHTLTGTLVAMNDNNLIVGNATLDGTLAVWKSLSGTYTPTPVYGGPSGAPSTDIPVAINAHTTVTGTTTTATPQIISSTKIWEMGLTGTFGLPLRLDDLVDSKSGWSNISAHAINKYGCIVGTASLTTTVGGTTTTSNHGIMLLPLQLKLLNGLTADFDGTIPTAWIPQSEFPEHDNLVTQTGTITKLGPIAIGAHGSGLRPLPGGIYYGLIVAAQAPASVPGIQYRWLRYYREREWDIIRNQSNGDWTVFNRDSGGTAPSQAPLGEPELVTYSNVDPSTVKHEFYAADTPGPSLPAGSRGAPLALDKRCHKDDFIVEIYSFTYKVQFSWDGQNWKDGQSLIINTYKVLQFKQAYTGDAINDLNVVTNSVSYGPDDPIMTSSRAAYIVGSTHILLDDNANIEAEP